MSRLSDWFLKGASGWSLLWWIPLVLVLYYTYLYYTLQWVADTFPQGLSSTTASTAEYVRQDGWLITGPVLALAMFGEEMLFRFLPLGVTGFILWHLGLLERPIGLVILLIVSVPASAVFGLVHGNVGNIFIQGVAGLLLSITYLKWGRLGLSPSAGIFAAFALHTANNLSLVALTYV